MHWITVLGISLSLAMDAFAVAIASGLSLLQVTPRQMFRLAFHFGFFQFLMPVIGWLVGREVTALIGAFDHWIAFGLLSFVGGKMLWEARGGDSEKEKTDPTRGLTLLTLSIATSLDALAVGLSLALLEVSIWGPAITIGCVTAALTALGMKFGSRLGPRWGHWAEAAGGCVLILIGLKIVWGHL